MDGWMGGLMIGYTGHRITEKNPMANLVAWNFEDIFRFSRFGISIGRLDSGSSDVR